jgi:septal ring factor EnvC (AmiA/AmiB activator)
MSKEEIRLRLEAGYRNQELPPEASTLGADQAIAIYAQLKQYQAELAHTKERLAEKTESEEKLRQKIDELQREVGKWQGQAELYRQLWEEERDDE